MKANSKQDPEAKQSYLHVPVSAELLRTVNVRAAENGLKIKDYVIGLVEADVAKGKGAGNAKGTARSGR